VPVTVELVVDVIAVHVPRRSFHRRRELAPNLAEVVVLELAFEVGERADVVLHGRHR
jgi:hypothetical protein